jgi:Helicase associated domain
MLSAFNGSLFKILGRQCSLNFRIIKNRYGDCNVPSRWKQNPTLSNWVNSQRSHQRISPARKERLNELGFAWNTRHCLWEIRFAELKEYVKQYGDCNVPADWEKNRQLGRWVGTQRYQHIRGLLSPERKARLDELQFVWLPKTGPRPSK